MPKKLTEAEKDARAKAAADKKAARAEAAKKKEHAKLKKHLDMLVKYQKADFDKIAPGITDHQLNVYAGRVRAFSDRMVETLAKMKEMA